MKTVVKFMAALTLISLNSCVLLPKLDCTPPQAWVIPQGKVLSDFYFSKYVCTMQAQYSDKDGKGGALNWASYSDCMKAYGFTPKEG